MKKNIAIILCLVLLIAALMTSCGKTEGRTLNLYTWSGMFPQEILDAFTEKTGIKINYVNFDTDETMLTKLEAAKGGDYDLVIADDYIIEMVISEGLASKLDKSRIPSIGNVNPAYTGQFYDPDDDYTVPYGAGVQTIVYNPAKVGVAVNGYYDLWDSSLEGRIGITSNFRVINGMALKVMGKSYNTNDVSEIRAAGELLNSLAPNIRLIKDDNLQDDLLTGEIDAAVMYTSQVTMAVMTDPSLRVVYPEEGIGFGIMAMFIPSNAPDSDAAHQFIEFVLDPDNGARCFEYLGYYCTYSASDDRIAEEFKSFLTLPDGLDTEDMEMIQNVSSEAEEAHLEVWNAFRELCN